MVSSRDVSVAFALVCDRGFAVGLCTHRHPRMGHLVWIAEPFFDHFPFHGVVTEDIETGHLLLASDAGYSGSWRRGERFWKRS